jgi:uncharacterized protein
MQLPTFQEIESLHKKYAASDKSFDLIFIHCQIIADIADQLITANHLIVDRELVKVGCLLHDIGVYPILNEEGKRREGMHYITHGSRGEAILREEGYPEIIWRMASHHTGVGLTRKDIEDNNLPLPDQDFLAETEEERLVMYADKFHSKSPHPHFNSYEQYKQIVESFGEGKAKLFEAMAQDFGIPDIQALSKKYNLPIDLSK